MYVRINKTTFDVLLNNFLFHTKKVTDTCFEFTHLRDTCLATEYPQGRVLNVHIFINTYSIRNCETKRLYLLTFVLKSVCFTKHSQTPPSTVFAFCT